METTHKPCQGMADHEIVTMFLAGKYSDTEGMIWAESSETAGN